jgi:hypothetical protein
VGSRFTLKNKERVGMKLRIDDEVIGKGENMAEVQAVDSYELWEKIGVKQPYMQWLVMVKFIKQKLKN